MEHFKEVVQAARTVFDNSVEVRKVGSPSRLRPSCGATSGRDAAGRLNGTLSKRDIVIMWTQLNDCKGEPMLYLPPGVIVPLLEGVAVKVLPGLTSEAVMVCGLSAVVAKNVKFTPTYERYQLLFDRCDEHVHGCSICKGEFQNVSCCTHVQELVAEIRSGIAATVPEMK